MVDNVRIWYKERYFLKHLNKEPIFSWRIREEGTERVIAKELNAFDAEIILHSVNKGTTEIADK